MGNFRSSRVGSVDWLGKGLLAPHVDAFKHYLTARGYAATTIANCVRSVAHFAQWAHGVGCASSASTTPPSPRSWRNTFSLPLHWPGSARSARPACRAGSSAGGAACSRRDRFAGGEYDTGG